MIEKKAIFIRVILISSLIIITAMAIFIKLLFIQGDLSDSVALNDPIIKLREIPSPRGNIYDINVIKDFK